MGTIVKARYERMTSRDCQKVALSDAKVMSTSAKNYVQLNLFGYYVLINTWLLCIEQWSAHGWVAVREFILREGLIETIREFDCAAMQIVRGEEITFSIARSLLRDVMYSGTIPSIPNDAARSVNYDPQATALFLFRYPKRFSPAAADKLASASINSFVETQQSLKEWQRTPHSYYIISRVRHVLHKLLPWDELAAELEKVSIDDIIFTSGVSLECGADLLSKLRSVASRFPEYFPAPFGCPMVSYRRDLINNEPLKDRHLEMFDPQYWGKHVKSEVHLVFVQAVPKNYKAARIIAPEMTVRQGYARRFFQIMDRYTPEGIALHDQGVNQELARLGSIDGRLATLDLHAASDRITWYLLGSVLPTRIGNVIRRVLPTHYTMDKNSADRRILQSAATMGNSITFWLESVVFYAIARAAVEEYNLLTGDVDSTVSTYGDDIIVPTKAAQTVIDWLEECGFIVNRDKSFYDANGVYRESCGEEYRRGIRITSIYYPRFPLMGKIGGPVKPGYRRESQFGAMVDTMTALLDLQHKLYFLCVPASIFLREVIREADPNMTVSTPDEGKSDIWDYESVPKLYHTRAVVKGFKWNKADTEDPTLRRGHSTPVFSVPRKRRRLGDKPEKVTDDEVLVMMYNYHEFLRKGPQYADELDKLLGITVPPLSIEDAKRTGSVRWVISD